tara:strand:- start:132 stop:335 length:204 start_codon:yes stop_codon:yes gene_type:complete
VIEQADIVMIDGNESALALVSKVLPDDKIAILQKLGPKSTNRTFIRLDRLTVVQSAKEARKRGRNKL